MSMRDGRRGAMIGQESSVVKRRKETVRSASRSSSDDGPGRFIGRAVVGGRLVEFEARPAAFIRPAPSSSDDDRAGNRRPLMSTQSKTFKGRSRTDRTAAHGPTSRAADRGTTYYVSFRSIHDIDSLSPIDSSPHGLCVGPLLPH